MNRMKFMKYRRWIIGGAAAAVSVSVAVTYYSSSPILTPAKPTNGPVSFPKWDYNWDKREPYSLVKPSKRSKTDGSGHAHGATDSPDDGAIGTKELEKKKAKSVRNLILIRHGEYNMNGEDDKEHYLTELGKKQAVLTGKRLKAYGIHFDSIVCSDMTRAIETTEIILKEMDQPGLCVECRDPILQEGAPCMAEPPSSTWHPDLHFYEDGPRIEAAFRKYFHRAHPRQENDSYEIIVCHANVIRYFACRAMQFPGEAWLRIMLHHCSLTVLSILPTGEVILQALGDKGHVGCLTNSHLKKPSIRSL